MDNQIRVVDVKRDTADTTKFIYLVELSAEMYPTSIAQLLQNALYEGVRTVNAKGKCQP